MSVSDTARRSPGRQFAALGLGLTALGIAAYAVQIAAQRLTTPWYLPCAATLGAILIAVSLWRRRTIWRALGLLVCLLLAGAEWTFVLATRLPAYNGSLAVGKPFPAFATTRANEAPFTERDLKGGPNSVLVFFRGRW